MAMQDLRWTCDRCGAFYECDPSGFSAELMARMVANHQAGCDPFGEVRDA